MTNFQLLALKGWVWIWTNILFALNLLGTLSLMFCSAIQTEST